ncbi:MAG: hypothetical protein EAZ37_09720 [Burkholderiales bacterium]|nr:MAG: hypothetical protein EAZ37_09720 [Burkholderiales bacterium]
MKPSHENAIDILIWVCLYGGLLGITVALALVRVNRSIAGWLGAGGSLVTALGIVLIYIRSRTK